MMSTLRGVGGKADMIIGRREVGVSDCPGRPILFVLLKKIGFAP